MTEAETGGCGLFKQIRIGKTAFTLNKRACPLQKGCPCKHQISVRAK